jgi:hypothetical protein
VSLTPIDADEFNRAMNRPAILSLSSPDARAGETVSAVGSRFTSSDVIHIEGIEAKTTFVSATLVTFVVPTVEGGRQRAVCIKQTDGTTSNNASLNVLPDILWIEQNGARSTANPRPRFEAGKTVTVIGTGFSPEPTIKVNTQYVPASDITYVNPTQVTFKLFRPNDVVRNPAGESVNVSLTLGDGAEARPVTIVLDTFVMLVMGDSIQWGQGLRSDLKFHSIVERHLGRGGAMGVYKTVHAHSGATIGVGSNHQENPVYGEVPTSHPTVLQQVDLYNDDATLVDLVLLDGGINDIGVNDIINPLGDDDLVHLTRKHCFEDMKVLLGKVTQRFPNAKVIVTGYYQIVSDDSDLNRLTLLLAGFGMLVGALGAAVGVGVSIAQKNAMVSRSRSFAEAAEDRLKEAIADVRAAQRAAGLKERVFFASPSFGPSNAIFAGNSWLWGLELDLGPADDKELGGVEADRQAACERVESEHPGRTDGFRCKRASMGHPNEKGAQAYAKAVIPLL